MGRLMVLSAPSCSLCHVAPRQLSLGDASSSSLSYNSLEERWILPPPFLAGKKTSNTDDFGGGGDVSRAQRPDFGASYRQNPGALGSACSASHNATPVFLLNRRKLRNGGGGLSSSASSSSSSSSSSFSSSSSSSSSAAAAAASASLRGRTGSARLEQRRSLWERVENGDGRGVDVPLHCGVSRFWWKERNTFSAGRSSHVPVIGSSSSLVSSRRLGVHGGRAAQYRLPAGEPLRGNLRRRRITRHVSHRRNNRGMTAVPRASSADVALGDSVGFVPAGDGGGNNNQGASMDDSSATSMSISSSSSSSSSWGGAGGGSPSTAAAAAAASDDAAASDKQQQQQLDAASGQISRAGGNTTSTSAALLRSIVVALIGGAAIALLLHANGGGVNHNAWIEILSRSGFAAAFSLIFVSEIGDKTFFIAALLAMRHSRWPVMVGATGALALMTVISVAIGRLFQRVPASFHTTVPIGEYLAVGLLIWFGLKSIKDAWDLPSASAVSAPARESAVAAAAAAKGDGGAAERATTAAAAAAGGGGGGGEMEEAKELLNRTGRGKKRFEGPLGVLVEAFCLVFVAEWGDRSMLATIALGAAQSPLGVAVGATLGHVVATGIAVVGGAFLARYISEKLVGYTGGVLFLAFAVATLMGVF